MHAGRVFRFTDVDWFEEGSVNDVRLLHAAELPMLVDAASFTSVIDVLVEWVPQS